MYQLKGENIYDYFIYFIFGDTIYHTCGIANYNASTKFNILINFTLSLRTALVGFFISHLDTMSHPCYSKRINKGELMTDQTQPEIAEVQSRNRAKNFDRENTNKLNQAKDIYKESNGLDNISEFDMNKFKEIMFR